MLDTDVCIYLTKRRSLALERRFERLQPGQVVVSVVTCGELYYGASKSRERTASLDRLAEFVRDIPVEDIRPDTAEIYGEIRTDLELRGRPIGNHDLWIAAHALSLGLTLVTNNEREFSRIATLPVQNWIK